MYWDKDGESHYGYKRRTEIGEFGYTKPCVLVRDGVVYLLGTGVVVPVPDSNTGDPLFFAEMVANLHGVRE
jgi:hypothetical protein